MNSLEVFCNAAKARKSSNPASVSTKSVLTLTLILCRPCWVLINLLLRWKADMISQNQSNKQSMNQELRLFYFQSFNSIHSNPFPLFQYTRSIFTWRIYISMSDEENCTRCTNGPFQSLLPPLLMFRCTSIRLFSVIPYFLLGIFQQLFEIQYNATTQRTGFASSFDWLIRKVIIIDILINLAS